MTSVRGEDETLDNYASCTGKLKEDNVSAHIFGHL